VATVVVVSECLLIVGGEGMVDEGLFSSERCPLPTARSFGLVMVLKAARGRRSTSEDDMVGCYSCLHLALEVSFLLRQFDGSIVLSLSYPTLGAKLL